MAKATLNTPSQTADMLEVSAATLRRYANKFTKHLSKHTKAKRRQYTNKDLAVLTEARDLIRGGANSARVNAILGVKKPTEEIVLPPNAMSHAELVSAMEQARDQMIMIGEEHKALKDKQVENTERIEALVAELQAIRSRSFVDRLLNKVPAV